MNVFIYEVSMFTGIIKLSPAKNQYSLQNIRFFAVHNQIFDDQ